jgi:phytoene dehydrogenase-like protein
MGQRAVAAKDWKMVDRETRHRRVRGEIQSHYDTIIAGAGTGGLTAAAWLANHGEHVLVLDQHYVPGGNATVFRRKEWLFDVGLHYIGECHDDGFIPKTLRECGVDDIRFRPMDDDFEVIHFPDFTFRYSRSVETFKRRLVEQFPSERRGIHRYLKMMEVVRRIGKAQQSGSKLRQFLGIIRNPLLSRYALKPLGEFLDTCTDNQQLRAVLTAQNGTYATPPEQTATALHLGLQAHYFSSGGWYPEGGGQAISDALAASIERNGGDIRLRSLVTHIDVKDGKARSLTFENKHLGERTVTADRIISNIDVKRLLNDIVETPAYPQKLRERYDKFTMTLPLYVVFLGLDLSQDELPYGNSNVWKFEGYDFGKMYEEVRNGHVPDKPFIYVSTASAKDPHNREIAPEGHTNVEVMTMVPSDLSFWGVTEEEVRDETYSDNEAYLEQKERIREACIDQFAALVPGLRDHIVYKEACTPLTHQRYVRSTGGTSYGFSMEPGQFFRRPGAKTPVEGLFLCGANCAAGHGIIGAMTSGVQAARAAQAE